MKKVLIFLCGLIAGVALTIGAIYIIGHKATGGDEPEKPQAMYGDPGISLFSEPGEVLSMKSFKIFQVLSNGTALAYSAEKTTVQYKWQYGEPVVFLLWGANARSKKALITNPRHLILETVHPSPLSAYNGFFGCRHFSKANGFLRQNGIEPIDWQL